MQKDEVVFAKAWAIKASHVFSTVKFHSNCMKKPQRKTPCNYPQKPESPRSHSKTITRPLKEREGRPPPGPTYCPSWWRLPPRNQQSGSCPGCSSRAADPQKTCERLHKAGTTPARNNQLGSTPATRKNRIVNVPISSKLLLKSRQDWGSEATDYK